MPYEGRAENLRTNDRGIEFEVVVKDNEGKEVFRRTKWLSTGIMTGLVAKDAVKRVVERMTQEIWGHIEGGKIALSYKTEIEAYKVNCDSFVDPKDRPTPQPGVD